MRVKREEQLIKQGTQSKLRSLTATARPKNLYTRIKALNWRNATSPRTLKTKSEQLLTKLRTYVTTLNLSTIRQQLTKLDWQKVKPAALALLIIFSIIMPFLPTEFASAATANLLPNGDITTGWTPSAGTTHYTLLDEGTTANATDHVRTASGQNVDGETEVLELENLANVVSASSVQVFLHTQIATLLKTADNINVSLIVNGTSVGTTTITPSTTAAWQSVTFNGTWTSANVDSMRVQFVRSRQGGGSGSSQTDDVRVNSVYAAVTYTVAANFEQSAYRWFENQDVSGVSTYAMTNGTSSYDTSTAVVAYNDGGYFVAENYSTAAHVISRYSSSGQRLWSNSYNAINGYSYGDLTITSDNNLLAVGYEPTVGVIVTKISPTGSVVWSRTWLYGSSYGGEVNVIELTDASYIVTASLNGSSVLHISSSGSLLASKNWATSYNSSDLKSTPDGGFLMTLHSTGLIKINSNLTIDWNVSVSNQVEFNYYWGAMDIDSNGDIVASLFRYTSLNGADTTFLKFSSSGALLWTKEWSGGGNDIINSLQIDGDGSFLAAGDSASYGTKNSALIVKYDASGNHVFSKIFDTAEDEFIEDMTKLDDGGIVVVGNTKGHGSGQEDVLILKFNSTGSIGNCSAPMCQTLSPSFTNNTYTTSSTTITPSDVTGTFSTHSYTPASPNITNSVIVSDYPLINVGNSLAALSSPATALAEGATFRLRMSMHVSVDDVPPGVGSPQFKMQYATRGSDNSCDVNFLNESYQDISASSGLVRFSDNPIAIDSQPLQANVNDPTHTGHTVVPQTYEESNNFGISTTIPNGADGMWDFALVDNGAPANTTYCFRAVYSTGATLASYSVIPQITTQAATINQANSSWYENQDGSQSNTLITSWGAGGNEYSSHVIETSDGGVAVAGETFTSSISAGSWDQTLVKYDASGVEQWSKTWGGDGEDKTNALVETSDGGIAVAGVTWSTGLSVGAMDQTLVKYDASGVEQWSRTWGGDGNDGANAVIETSDGGIVVAGHTASAGLTAGGTDQTLVKYDANGVEQWSKTWGGNGGDIGVGVIEASTGAILTVGHTLSTGLTSGGNDQTLVKYDANGVEQWSKTWGGTGTDFARDVIETDNGDFVVIGSTASTAITSGDFDQTLVKYDANGVEQWSKTWGGTGTDHARAVAKIPDGGFVVTGYSSAELSVGGNDMTVVKYNANGIEQWSKTWGGPGVDIAEHIIYTTSGNIILTGRTDNTSILTAGLADQMMLKFDSNAEIRNCTLCVNRTMSEVDRTMSEVNRTTIEVNRGLISVSRTMSEVDRTAASTQYYHSGHLTFAKSWGGTGTDEAYDVVQADDGGYVVAGDTSSFTAGAVDTVLTKYSANGTEQWSNTWGAGGSESPQTLLKATDGGYVVAGYTTSYTAGGYDQYLAKFDSNGIEQWSKTWGGTGNDFTRWMDHTSDGGYIVIGETDSYTAGSVDFSIVKYNASGIEQWTKTWGGAGFDYGRGVSETSDGGFILAGYSNSFGGGNQEAVLVKLDSNGTEQWSKRWGAAGNDYGYHAIQTLDGGYVMTGRTDSYDTGDAILVKFDTNGTEQWSKTWSGAALDVVYQVVENADGDLFTVGRTASYGSGGDDQLVIKYNSSGIEQWSKTYGGSGSEVARRITLTDDGGVISVGGTPSAGLTAGGGDHTIVKYDKDGNVGGCSPTVCRDVAITETDRGLAETDIVTAETDRILSEVDRAVTEVDRTTVSIETDVASPAPWLALYNIPGQNLASGNTALSNIARDKIYRLRLLQNIGNKRLSRNGANFKLQAAPRVGTCDLAFTGEQFSDITSSSSLQFYTGNSNITDGGAIDASGSDPTFSNSTVRLQAFETANNYTVRNTIVPGESGVWDFALGMSAPSLGGNYCIRAVWADGTPFDTYSHIPEINVPYRAAQHLRHGKKFDASGVRQPYMWR